MNIRTLRGAAILAAPVCLLCASPSAASDDASALLSERQWEELVVVGNYLPRPAREVGSAVTVLTERDIQVRQTNLASELLREVPGVAVNRNGPVGSQTQVRIRGAEGNHTLVLIDGIEANDPGIGSEFNFADLLTWDIGRVEVLRGPQSALYGSEAVGGVISLSTTEPEPGLSARGEVESGSFGTTQLGASLSGASDRVSGLVSAMRFETDGISASDLPDEREKDGYDNTTLHAKLDVDVSDVVDARLVLRRAEGEAENDRQDFDFPDTPTQGLVVDDDSHIDSTQLYGLAELNARLLDGHWLHRLAYGYTDTESDNYSDGARTSGTRGERRKLQYESSLRWGDGTVDHTLTGGVQREDLEFRNISVSTPGANQHREDDQTSFIGEYALGIDGGLAGSVSVRRDDNDRFDDATTFRATGSYLVRDSGTRLHASYGEGITNPSFFELFGFIPDTFVSNPDLKPERSRSWDAGVEQALFGGRALVDVTYFDAELEDEILTVFLPTFESTVINQEGKSDRQGVEVTAQSRLSEQWSVRATYTYLDATDPDGQDEIRRPEHAGSVNVNFAFLDGRGNVNVGALFNGEQEDSEFVNATPRTRATLDEYTLVNVAITFDATERVQLFARGDNLLDEDYTEVFGFRSPGAAGYVGVRARL